MQLDKIILKRKIINKGLLVEGASVIEGGNAN